MIRAALLCLVACTACDNHGSTPDWSRMITQPKLQPFGETDQFDDRSAMRPLPAGVIAREWTADPALREGRSDDGHEISAMPRPVTRATLERGRNRFEIVCASCHGLAGDADSAVARNMQRRRPPSLHEPRLVALTPGALYRVIVDGYGLMPSYATMLSIDDRWAVIGYVRTLQLAWSAKLAQLPADVQQDVARRLR